MNDPRYEGLSPREELYERVLRTWLAKDVHTMGAARALVDAYQDEVHRQAAERLRAEADDGDIPGSPLSAEAARGLRLAADLIDPDKDTE